MDKHSGALFRIFGIDIRLHFSWWFIFILLAWSLSTGYFPEYFPGLPEQLYWLMGILSALLLFGSVVLHELSHSLVAKTRHITVQSITLFFFGGVAGIEREEMKPSSEFLIAIAGPLFSFILAGLFYLLHISTAIILVKAMALYLYQLNLVLGIFNLVPGFPLDGGRAFRAVLYAYYHDLKKATRIASTGGKLVAGILVALGALSVFGGAVNGLWFILLGAFLYFIAGMSYEQVVVKEILSHVGVKEVMSLDPPFISPEMTLRELIDRYSATDEETFIVKGKLPRIVDLARTGTISRYAQKNMKVKTIAQPLRKPLALKDNAYTAFKRFAELQQDALPVIDKGKICGIVQRRMVMHRLNWDLKYGETE